jgi:hypothetical protein
MRGNRKLSGLHKSVAVGLSLVLLLLTLAPVGQAEPQEPAQWDPTTPWRLPFMRINHTAIYDAANNRLIVFGGWNGRKFFSDVWALSLTPGSEIWSKIDFDGVVPPARGQHTAIYDAANGRMVIFGGHGRHRNFHDVWALDLTAGAETWSQLTLGGPAVPARRWHSAIYDATQGQMVVFGGGGGGALFDDVWVLDLTPGAETWSQLTPTGGPPTARAQHTAIYDPVHRWLVVFGGWTYGSVLNDTWVLNLAAQTWTQASPIGSPPAARRGHTAIYDAANGRMLLFGGVAGSGFYNDLWALSLVVPASWTQLSSSSTVPGTRAWHTATVDQTNGRLVVVGGRGIGSLAGEAHWSLNLTTPAWSPFTPTISGVEGGAKTSPQQLYPFGLQPSLTLEIEDAPPDTTVSLLRDSEVWFVVKPVAQVSDHSTYVDVTLTMTRTGQIEISEVGTRHEDWEEVTNWSAPVDLGDGQYRFLGRKSTPPRSCSKATSNLVHPRALRRSRPVPMAGAGRGSLRTKRQPVS